MLLREDDRHTTSTEIYTCLLKLNVHTFDLEILLLENGTDLCQRQGLTGKC